MKQRLLHLKIPIPESSASPYLRANPIVANQAMAVVNQLNLVNNAISTN
jgi:hypothetical protein